MGCLDCSAAVYSSLKTKYPNPKMSSSSLPHCISEIHDLREHTKTHCFPSAFSAGSRDLQSGSMDRQANKNSDFLHFPQSHLALHDISYSSDFITWVLVTTLLPEMQYVKTQNWVLIFQRWGHNKPWGFLFFVITSPFLCLYSTVNVQKNTYMVM